ncbi:unnamed protein product [Brugia timori]|uniref:Uncharacterized protein n=1 Tax=Brugia timori TaxID=42155 RepID=A0A0R3Q7B4_9BILA|nr:unnamed protein product [Brugia timori]
MYTRNLRGTRLYAHVFYQASLLTSMDCRNSIHGF